MKQKLLIIYFSLFLNSFFSQRYNFNNYSLESGLPQSTIYEIFQDHRGFLWLGTSGGGAVQFDGLKFKPLNKRDGLAGNLVRAFNQDKEENLWIGTDNGISIYDGKKIKNLKLFPNQNSKTVYKIFIDKVQNIWVSYPGFGLIKYKNVNDTTPKLYNEESGLSGNFIFDIIELSDDELILATYSGGINILNTKTDKVKIFSTEEGLPSAIIFSVEKDTKGNFWFGSNDSKPFYINEKYLKETSLLKDQIHILNDFPDKTVWDISKSKDELYFATDKAGIVFLKDNEIKEYNAHNGLPSNQILKIFIDNSDLVWIGTNDNGLCKFSGTAFSHLTISPFNNSEAKVFSILQDKNKNYWVASHGNGLIKMSYENGKATILKTFTVKDGLPDDFLTSLCFDSSDNLWIGTSNNGVAIYNGSKFSYITEKDGLSADKINAIYMDSKNRMWISTNNGVTKVENNKFDLSNESNGLINNEVQCVIEDKLENIWIATYGGLARYNGATLENFDEENGLFDKIISCLSVNEKNEILIGTFGGGIYYTDANKQKKQKFIELANDSILSSSNIYGINFLSNEEIIIATDKGIDKLIFKDEKVIENKSFDKTDGFSSIENNINAILKTENLIWFGTVKGITIFDPKAVVMNLSPPMLHLLDIKLFYNSIDWAKRGYKEVSWNSFPENFVLNYKENNLTFSFQAINFPNPNKVKYKYKLEGADSEWLPVVNLPEASYPSLNPGDYTFMVMASNENNIWSEPLTFKFTIDPPFYKTWWFISLVIILIIAIIITYVKWRESELKKKNIVLEQTVTERTQEISEQKKEIESKNKDITDSIIYARRIQKAILPPEEKIKSFVKNSFVVYHPKDIISGDFYYFNTLDKNGTLIEDVNIDPRYYIIAVADCTGHGVPGALMSMIGFNGLNYALSKTIVSGEVLDTLSAFVEQSLASHSAEVIKDGMDICLCIIDLKTKTLNFSGANNPLYIIRKSENPEVRTAKKDSSVINKRLIYEIKADKQPVGAFDDRKKFTTHQIELFESDELVLFTDGYADQFGGPNGKKFKYSALKDLLLNKSNDSFEDQKQEIQKAFTAWKGNLEQVDDVCIIGISPLKNKVY